MGIWRSRFQFRHILCVCVAYMQCIALHCTALHCIALHYSIIRLDRVRLHLRTVLHVAYMFWSSLSAVYTRNYTPWCLKAFELRSHWSSASSEWINTGRSARTSGFSDVYVVEACEGCVAGCGGWAGLMFG